MHRDLHLLKYLQKKRLPYLNNNPLHLLAEKYALEFFEDIDRNILKKCYFEDIILCRKVLHQLAFYGAIFQGGLHNYSILLHENDSLYLWKETFGEHLFNPPIPFLVLRKVKEYGILYEQDAIGLPLLSFVRDNKEFPFEKVLGDSGFEFITYCEFMDKLEYYNQSRDNMRQQGDASRIIETPLKISGTLSPSKTTLGVLAAGFPASNIHKIERTEDAWAQVLNDLEGLMSEPGGSGKKSTRQVCDELKILREKIELSKRNKALEMLVDTPGEQLMGTQDNDGFLKRISLGRLQIAIPKESMKDALKLLFQDQLLITPILDTLSTQGISTMQELPDSLESLEQSLSKGQVFALFDSLCHVFCVELTFKSRIQSIISSIRNIASVKSGKGIQRVLLILETKFNMLNEKKNPTLKDVGYVLGITRERVRQILSRFWQNELPKYNCFMEYIVDNINRVGGLIPMKDFVPELESLTQFEQFVINEVFNVSGMTLMGVEGFLTTLSKREFATIINELEADLQDTGELPTYPSTIEHTVQAFVIKRRLHFTCQKALLQIVFTNMLVPWGDGFILKNLFRNEKVVCVLKEFPQGIAIHKDFDHFFARLDERFPGEFDKHDRYIYASIVNSDKAFLWGWGIYIHRDNTQIKRTDLEIIVTWIHEQFGERVEKLSMYAAYNEFRDIMDLKGIPNEHALYSCLRYFFNQEFFMPKSPYVYPNYIGESKHNTEILAEYIRSKKMNTTFTELQEEFVNRRGWKEYTLNQAITLSQQIIRTARGEYGLVEFYPYAAPEKLKSLAQCLAVCLSDEMKQINVRMLFIQKQVTCNKMKVYNDIALYSLMEKFFSDRFSFPQYPHIQLKLTVSCLEISNVKLLDDYMKNLHNSIFRDELKREFVVGRCWTDKALENALRANPQIFVLQYGNTAEYVHAEVIGWDKRKQAQLESWTQANLERFSNGPMPYGNLQRDLFRPQQFPQLDADVCWTLDLLKDCLKDCSFIGFIGTTRALFVPIPNCAEIYDDVGFLEYILRTDFQGSADLAKFQKRLAELNFSREGEIPKPYKLDSELLPYVFIADRIMLRN